MTGLEFYLIAFAGIIGSVGGYIVGYRTGWTDGSARARRFESRGEQA